MAFRYRSVGWKVIVGNVPIDLTIRCHVCGIPLEAATWKPFIGGGICPRCLREHEAEEQMGKEPPKRREYRPDDIHFTFQRAPQGQFAINREFYDGVEREGLRGFLNVRELMYLVTEGAKSLGWEAGPNLQLNPQNLPTREALEAAYTTTIEAHPLSKGEPTFVRFLKALAMLTAYVPWLPLDHRKQAERDIRYLERRMEELVMFRRFVVEFLGKFQRVKHGASASEMYASVVYFLKMLKETVGVDLTGDDDPNNPMP